MVWKLGTVVFGIATILLLTRELARPDPLDTLSAPPEKRAANQVIERDEPGEQDREIVDEEHPTAVSGSAPPSRTSVDPRWLSESPRALVARLVPRRVENVESRVPWKRIVRDPEAFSARTVAAADRVIAVELEVEPTTEHGNYVKKRFEELRGWRAAREKRLEEEKAYEAFLAGL